MKKYLGIIIIIIIAMIYLIYSHFIQQKIKTNNSEKFKNNTIANNFDVDNIVNDNVIEEVEIIDFKEEKENDVATFIIKNNSNNEIIIDNNLYLVNSNQKQLILRDYIENQKRTIAPHSKIKLTINNLSKYKETFIFGYNTYLDFNEILLYKPVYVEYSTKKLKGVILSEQNKNLIIKLI